MKFTGYENLNKIDLDSMSPEEIALLDKSLRTVQKQVPAMFCGLNVAQYRSLKAAYTLDPDTGYPPAVVITSFANGVGKSHLMILDMIGWTQGPDCLNWRLFPECAVDYYNSLSELRDKGLLSMRLVCMADDMKADGSVYMLLKEIFPMAKVTAMDNNKCYRQIDVRNPFKPLVVNSIAVKTFDQTEVKHSGSTCKRIWINEPLPDNLVGETVGRIRSRKGEPPGSISMFATLLDGANWVSELDDDPDLRVAHVRGHLYENCVGEEVTEHMAAEVRATIGVQLHKNPQGEGYLTNGVLSRQQIKTQIALWRKTCPHQLEARKSGAPISGGGRIWPTFNREIHVIPDENFKINPEWPIVQVADPHSARPTFTFWAQLTPHDRLIIFEEWPNVPEFGYYESLDTRVLSIPQECETWDVIEQRWKIYDRDLERVGDPNRFHEPQSYTNQTLHALYAQHGYSFNLSVSDNLEVGHAKVSEYLYCDESRLRLNPHDIIALPRLFICKRCMNVQRAIENYAMKKGKKGGSVTEKVDPKYKDGADCVRYLVMWHSGGKTFSSVKDSKGMCDDYERLKKGRVPKRYRTENQGFNAKGRKVLV